MFVTIVRLGVRQMDNSGVCCTGMTFYARSVTSGNIETQFSSGMDFASLSCRSKLILTFRLVAVQRGVAMAQCYEMLEQEAKEAGFALHWPRAPSEYTTSFGRSRMGQTTSTTGFLACQKNLFVKGEDPTPVFRERRVCGQLSLLPLRFPQRFRQRTLFRSFCLTDERR